MPSAELRNQIIGVSVASVVTIVTGIVWAVWSVAEMKADFLNRTESRWTCHNMELWVREVQAANPDLNEENFPMPECHHDDKH